MAGAEQRPAHDGGRRRGWSSSRPTIEDVAGLSGVSKTTVSNVFRGSGRVSPETSRRVRESARVVGYRPNGLARNLVRRRADTIAVLVGDLANTFYAELVKLLERHASEAAYTTIICNTDGRADLEAARVETLLERAVSGVVMLQFSGEARLLHELDAARVPVVVVSCWEERADCVAVDDRAGTGLAVEHLRGLGHRRIAYASGPLIEAATDRMRAGGYEDRMRAEGLPPRLVRAETWSEERPGYPAVLRELVRGADPVTAFVVANDLMAVQLMDALEGAGLRVPQDVSVVGFDGIDLGAHSRIALTTIAQPRAELAALGLDLLARRMAAPAPGSPPRRVTLEPVLVARGSTAGPRAEA